MNEHADDSELPELTDEDVELLYAICKRASASTSPPFKALFAAYDNVFAEQQIEQQHDGVVFRYLMRVGESTRTPNQDRRIVDLVEQLRNVLDAHGVTIIEPSEDGAEEALEPIARPSAATMKPSRSPRRRVSFDDARFEETWLSEYSEPISPDVGGAESRLMSLPPRKGRVGTSTRRTRSTSSQRDLPIRTAAPKHSRRSSHHSLSDANGGLHRTLLFDPSQTQLEQNAEAYHSSTVLRSARQNLHIWRQATLQRQRVQAKANSTAIAHDRRTLLRQAIDQWRQALEAKQREKRRLEYLDYLEKRARRCWDLFLLTKAFTHWATTCELETLRIKVAKRYVLKVTYFKKWRAIAVENQMKVRRILVRKYLAVWREKIARRLLWQEQAVARYEETLMRKCKTNWFWHFCSRRVEGWYEQWVQRRALHGMQRRLESRQILEQQGDDLHLTKLVRRCLASLHRQTQERRQADASAAGYFDATITAKGFRSLQKRAKLAPVQRTLTLRLSLNLQAKTMRIWSLHVSLTEQATEVDRKRILQRAWTNWNDALRCRALAQKIDERIVVENLYRWLLQERLQLFLRTTDRRLLARALCWCVSKVQQERDKLADASAVFSERQRRRRLANGMLRLNVAMRNREDAARTAVEFINGRALPQVIDIWKEKTDRARRLTKWAADARFYCLCTSTLSVWSQKANEQKHNRRRNAYAQVRARIKIRLVGGCFERWRARTTAIQEMDAEAVRRAQVRPAEHGTAVLHQWRRKINQCSAMHAQAVAVDQQKLMRSAFSAIVVRHADLSAIEQQAIDYRRDTDLSLLAGGLRRLQWATFTVARKLESAEALWLRNRDQHIKHMLRHWTDQVVNRRAAALEESDVVVDDEPESPTLWPATRAASRLAQVPPPSSPPVQSAPLYTPGYLRTPSRSRRAARFRALPIPAPFTPMVFDSAYLASTSAPGPEVGGLKPEQPSFGVSPQVTPFERKLRAGGFVPPPPSAMKGSVFRAPTTTGGNGTSKSVRFTGAGRFRRRNGDDHEKFS